MSLCKRLVAKQIVTAKVVAEFLQEAKDVGDTVDCWEVEGMLLPVKHGCGVKQTGLSTSARQRGQEESSPRLALGLPGYTKAISAQASSLPP